MDPELAAGLLGRVPNGGGAARHNDTERLLRLSRRQALGTRVVPDGNNDNKLASDGCGPVMVAPTMKRLDS